LSHFTGQFASLFIQIGSNKITAGQSRGYPGAKHAKRSFRKIDSRISDKISKIWLVAFLAEIQAVCIQNFSSLALKLRKDFEVTDGHIPSHADDMLKISTLILKVFPPLFPLSENIGF